MPVLRAAVRVRDEPARAHPAAAPGHPRAVPALLAHVHAQQHRAPPHRARAPPPGHAAPTGPAAQPHAVSPRAPTHQYLVDAYYVINDLPQNLILRFFKVSKLCDNCYLI